MNTKVIKLDINKKLYDTLTAKQGDTKSRFLLFNLLDGSIPFNLSNRSVRVYAIKPDGKEVFNDLIVNNANLGYCTLELTNQMLAVSGTLKLEIMVIENDSKLTSNVFYLDVKESINSEKAIVSTNEFTALLNGLASLNEYDNYKNEIAEARGGETKLKKRLDNFDSSLDNIENKLLNPEMFRNEGDSDQIVLEKAINYASINKMELHLYKNYIIEKLVINKNLTIISHNITINDSVTQNVFIEITSQARVNIKGVLSIDCRNSNVGILNNDSVLDFEYIFVTSAKECNVRYKKTNTHGYGDITHLKSNLTPIGLHLDGTDIKVKRYQGFCCLTHIKNSGGGNFIENAHGWQLNDDVYGDYVTNSTMLEVTGGSCSITNLYADTTENAIKLPNGNEYTLVSIANLIYFLNRTYYPEGINRPYPFRNIENFKGQLSCVNLQLDNASWKDGNGRQVEIIPSIIDDSRISIKGICNNGYSDFKNALSVKKGSLTNYITNENTLYVSPYTRKFYMDKNQKNILIQCTMNKEFPNNQVVYSVDFIEPFNEISLPSLVNAYVYNNGNIIPMVVKIYEGNLEVSNKSGNNISAGSLHINIQATKF